MMKVVYKGTPPVRKQMYRDEVEGGQFNVLLTTYEYIMKDKAQLKKFHWQYIIVDEGHRMKNAQSKFAQTLGSVYQSRHRVLLTGTYCTAFYCTALCILFCFVCIVINLNVILSVPPSPSSSPFLDLLSNSLSPPLSPLLSSSSPISYPPLPLTFSPLSFRRYTTSEQSPRAVGSFKFPPANHLLISGHFRPVV